MAPTQGDEPGAPLGRREQHKRATREALQRAAERLFAERGVTATTVRDIAEAAGVTERTFFRYFSGKEDLLLDDAFFWMPAFQQAVLDRPVAETPLTAVREALKLLAPALTRLDRSSPLALFAENVPAHTAPISGRAMLLRLENDVADTLEQRLRTGRRRSQPATPGDYRLDVRTRAELLARASIAAFRTAMICDLRLRQADEPDRPSLSEIMDQAFLELGRSRS